MYDQEEVQTGWILGQQCGTYRRTYNQVRPHESLAFATPQSAYLAPPIAPPRALPGRFAGVALVGQLATESDSLDVSNPNLFPPQIVQKT